MTAFGFPKYGVMVGMYMDDLKDMYTRSDQVLIAWCSSVQVSVLMKTV